MEYISEPLFTLTAEEVEIVDCILKRVEIDKFDSTEDIETAINLISRIKQWQEHNKTDQQCNP